MAALIVNVTRTVISSNLQDDRQGCRLHKHRTAKSWLERLVKGGPTKMHESGRLNGMHKLDSTERQTAICFRKGNKK